MDKEGLLLTDIEETSHVPKVKMDIGEKGAPYSDNLANTCSDSDCEPATNGRPRNVTFTISRSATVTELSPSRTRFESE